MRHTCLIFVIALGCAPEPAKPKPEEKAVAKGDEWIDYYGK